VTSIAPSAAARGGAARLGLPAGILACLFDLDGVLVDTTRTHAAAWKHTFDRFLAEHAQRARTTFVPFDEVEDYQRYVDGKHRADGVRSFLASRGIELPESARGGDSVESVGDRKNELLLALIAEQGVEAYDGSIRFVRAARDAGMRCAVVSSSANCRAALAAAGIEDLFDVRVDGRTAAREHLRGKPAPDTFLAAARLLGVRPPDAAVFEDALAGVEAGAAGGFGVVVGVDRHGRADELRAHGAGVVVADLGDLLEPR
jgi:beta-phosphoglucomutase family hydrolase